MKKITGLFICGLLLGGCATHGQMEDMEEESSTNQKILRENENRLKNLESSVTALNSQVAQLNNRVYEVRTRNGQKTAMQVVPIVSPGANAAEVPAAPAPVQKPKTPVGKKIDPAKKPAALQATAAPQKPKPTPAPKTAAPAGASGSVGRPEAVGGPSGQLAGADNGDLALPPSDIPVPQNNVNVHALVAPATASTVPPAPAAQETPVPVPVLPVSDLSLPPEHPSLPTVEAAPAPTPAPQGAPAKATPASVSARGEEAAYKTALNAVRSGRTSEGIKLFQDFLQKYPNGRYAANADFWIGECLYSQGKYQDALNQFQVVNNNFPKHHKNADALLKAAMSLSKMGDRAGAQAKYQELVSSFPNSDAAKRARSMGLGR